MKRLALAGLVLSLAAATPSYGQSDGPTAQAIFAGGCFWCVEADFDKVPGVTETISGYAGGESSDPTYETYQQGGHREAVKITYDPSKVSYRELTDIFFRTVDPLDDGGQFCDRGFGYTTAIWPGDEEQAEVAEASKAAASEALGRDIRTPIEPIGTANFTAAEEYHQNYYQKNDFRLSPGGLTASAAYKYYRSACGRDNRVRNLWDEEAFEGIPGMPS